MSCRFAGSTRLTFVLGRHLIEVMRCGSFLWRFAAICAVLGCTMKCVRAFVPTRRREALGFRAASTLRPAATSGPLRSSTSRPTAYQRGRMQQPFRLLAQTIDKPDVTVRCAPPDFATEANEKYFEFSRLEKSIYEWWEQAGYFQPSSDTAKKPYVIPMPPPNVTGYLHMGHAMFVALQVHTHITRGLLLCAARGARAVAH